MLSSGSLPPSPILEMAQAIALCHHERWDGSGYPRKMSGNNIPLTARICAVADTFDRLTTKRPHRDGWSITLAAQRVVNESGIGFDPKVVEAFSKALPKILAIKASISK